MTGEVLLRFENLTASYAGREVFGAASLALGAGAYALWGANGSGKSTLLRLLAGAQPPDSGDVWIGGISLAGSPEAARRRLSYVPDESSIYPFITGREFLRFVATAKRARLDPGVKRLAAALGVMPHLETRFDAMSLGTQKKLLLCAAWIGETRVILMDEPTNGLDEVARQALITELRAKSADSTVFYASHDTDFVTATGASTIMIDEICRRS